MGQLMAGNSAYVCIKVTIPGNEVVNFVCLTRYQMFKSEMLVYVYLSQVGIAKLFHK